jgi:hypothetical protein
MLVTLMPLPPTDTLTARPTVTVMASVTSSWHSSASRRRSLRHRLKHRPLQHRLHLSLPAHHRRLRLPPTATTTISSTSSMLPRQRRNLARDQLQVRRHLQHRPFGQHTNQPNPDLPPRHPLFPTRRLSNSRTLFSTCSRGLPMPPAHRSSRPCRLSPLAHRTRCVMAGRQTKSQSLGWAVWSVREAGGAVETGWAMVRAEMRLRLSRRTFYLGSLMGSYRRREGNE